jgi:hypothetical protein
MQAQRSTSGADDIDAIAPVFGEVETADTSSAFGVCRLVAGLVSASAGSGHGICIAATAAAATAPRAASEDEFGGGTPKAAADELGG